MRSLLFAFFAITFAITGANALDIAGTWQGETPSGRKVIQITKSASGNYSGQFFFLGDAGGTLNGNPLEVEVRPNRTVHLEFKNRFGAFEGKLSFKEDVVAGTWRGSFSSQPLTLRKASPANTWPIDPAHHIVHMLDVGRGVKLEVLDWGGRGRPLFLLAGLGNTAHDFDAIAPKFADRYHVYGITRRGFGLSSAPEPTEANYNPDQLADDDLAVARALGIKQAFFAGHSIAGQELSSIATRHSEKVLGLIYLDSAGDYAYFYPSKDIDAARWDGLDAFIPILRRDLKSLQSAGPIETKRLIAEIRLLLPRVDAGLANYNAWPQPPVRKQEQLVRDAILSSAKAYPGNNVPALAIYAYPKKCSSDCDTAAQQKSTYAFMNAFGKGHPKARVIRWPNTEHYIHRARESDVVREMRAFMDHAQ